MVSLKQHEENAKSIKIAKEKSRMNMAVEILKTAIGADLLEQAEDFGPSNRLDTYVKFKNHKKIYVKPVQYVGTTKYDFYVVKDNGPCTYCGNLGDALIEAEIPNTFWNRLTGKYKR